MNYANPLSISRRDECMASHCHEQHKFFVERRTDEGASVASQISADIVFEIRVGGVLAEARRRL
jgi:hypothetical protein